jgi:hypothetical protein
LARHCDEDLEPDFESREEAKNLAKGIAKLLKNYPPKKK